MTKVIQLIPKDGALYFPYGGFDYDASGFDPVPSKPSMLLCRYDTGDCDKVPWPLVSDFVSTDELKARLARALYDERECNEFFPTDAAIALPDGNIFNF